MPLFSRCSSANVQLAGTRPVRCPSACLKCRNLCPRFERGGPQTRRTPQSAADSPQPEMDATGKSVVVFPTHDWKR
jgi:hypothetical protein